MRKVTATAVILTALTGCSQSSGIPSTQWSFKVPSVGETSTSSQPANADVDKESSADSELSEKTQMFANHAGNSRMMGPAFEQPDAEALAKASHLGRPGSREASSSLSASLANGLATQTSTRPDPVAQVRAYLNASSPIALTNRTPYSSQVYLSSAPAADSSFVPSVPSLDYLSTAQLGIDSTAMSEASNSLPASSLPANSLPAPATATYSPLPVAEASPVAEALPAQNNSSYVAVGSEAYSAGYPNAGATSRSSDGLPQLAASVPSTYTALPSNAAQAETALSETSQPETSQPEAVQTEAVQTEAVQTEAVQTEADSIGTAILRNLQRSSSETAADITTSNTAPAIASPTNITAAPAQSAPLPTFSPSAATPLPPQLANLLPSETASVGATQAYANSEPATLVRLTQTMPEREASPLVDSFRTGSDLAELPVEALPLSPQSESLGEPLSESLGESLAPASTPDNSRIETDLRSSEASPSLLSPLLEGLRRESSPQSTLYVPIAEAAPVNSSNVLISGATDTLGAEVSTSAFTDELARSNVFSSVLSSPALLASANAPNFDIFSKPGLAELTLQQDKITLAAHQTSKRRQRLTWL
jgi:hypothetical protein